MYEMLCFSSRIYRHHFYRAVPSLSYTHYNTQERVSLPVLIPFQVFEVAESILPFPLLVKLCPIFKAFFSGEEDNESRKFCKAVLDMRVERDGMMTEDVVGVLCWKVDRS